jgi:integrase
MTMKFTNPAIAALALPAGKSEHFEWDPDLPGFGLRLRGTSKRWVIQYRVNSRQRRESLGDIRRVELAAARKIARQRFAKVELGVDPAVQRKAHALTLRAVITRYLEARRPALRPSSYRNVTRYLERDWSPLHGWALADITRADVAARLQELSKRGRVTASRARETLSALFAWSMREGLCEANPVNATNDPSAGMQPRERVLSDDELRAIWNACRDDAAGRLVRLLLLTGCRRDELGALQWSELAGDVLTIPGTRTKNGRTLTLPLPTAAVELITEVPRQDGGAFVFGRSGGAPFSGWSLAKTRLDCRIAAALGRTLPHWRLHDLRRTMRTGLGKLGVPPHVAELAINHVKGGVQAVYDRHAYQGEIADALARWANHVLAVVEGRVDNVVALHSA